MVISECVYKNSRSKQFLPRLVNLNHDITCSLYYIAINHYKQSRNDFTLDKWLFTLLKDSSLSIKDSIYPKITPAFDFRGSHLYRKQNDAKLWK